MIQIMKKNLFLGVLSLLGASAAFASSDFNGVDEFLEKVESFYQSNRDHDSFLDMINSNFFNKNQLLIVKNEKGIDIDEFVNDVMKMNNQNISDNRRPQKL